MKIEKLSYKHNDELQRFKDDAMQELQSNIRHFRYPDEIQKNKTLSWEDWNRQAPLIRELNQNILDEIANKAGVYAISTRTSEEFDWQIKYIGQTIRTYSKGRINSHLIRRYKATGAQIEKVKSAVEGGQQIGISFIQISPDSLRHYVETELISAENHLDWNIHGNREQASAEIPPPVAPGREIFLIACSSTKLNEESKAKELFVGNLFKKSLAYAESQHPDHIFILSSQYGLLELDQIIEPYDVNMKKMGVDYRKDWAQGVLNQLRKKCDLKHDYFVILAGEKYRQYLIHDMEFIKLPLAGLRIGEQLQYLNNILAR